MHVAHSAVRSLLLVALLATCAASACGNRATPSPVADTTANADAFAATDAASDALPNDNGDAVRESEAASGDSSEPGDVRTVVSDVTATAVWVHYPKPNAMTLRGDLAPLSWQTNTLPASITGEIAIFELPSNGLAWQVKPLLSGAWSIGANHVVKAGSSRHIYPYFDPKLSAPRRDDFVTTGPDGKPRTVRVRLPAGYDENTLANYPLVVMLDGQNVFDAATATFGVAWEVDEVIDLLLQQAKLTEVVVAAVDHAGSQRIFEYTPWPSSAGQGGGGAAFFVWANSKLVPQLHTKFRLQAGPQGHTMGGSSLGGLMSLYGVGAHPETWRGAIAMSGSWWWANNKMQSWIKTAPGATGLAKVWIDAGDKDDGLADTQALRDAMIATGWALNQTLGYYEAKNANHSEQSWSARVHLPLQFFFDPADRVAPF